MGVIVPVQFAILALRVKEVLHTVMVMCVMSVAISVQHVENVFIVQEANMVVMVMSAQNVVSVQNMIHVIRVIMEHLIVLV